MINSPSGQVVLFASTLYVGVKSSSSVSSKSSGTFGLSGKSSVGGSSIGTNGSTGSGKYGS